MKTKEFISAAIIGCSTAIIVYEAGEKICNWFDRRRRKRKIIENIKEDGVEEFINFIEDTKENILKNPGKYGEVNLKKILKLKEDILKKDLDKYSDEDLKGILKLTYYFKIYKNVNDIIDILEKSLQEKGEK